MPAAAFSALAAICYHSLVTVDDTIGIKHGMDEYGLLVQSISNKPTRALKSKADHLDNDVIHIFSKRQLDLSVEADVTRLAGPLSNPHPGAAFHKNYIKDFYADIAHGFDASGTGYFILMEPETSSAPADLHKTKFTARWFGARASAVNLVTAPLAPIPD